MKKSQRQIRKEYKEKGIKTGKERYNIGVTILLILGLEWLTVSKYFSKSRSTVYRYPSLAYSTTFLTA